VKIKAKHTMPRGNNLHRPGVKVIRSPHPNKRQPKKNSGGGANDRDRNNDDNEKGKKTPEYLAKQLKSAKALEDQLQGLGDKSSEAGMKLRSHLCEVLSDLILAFPAESSKEDCFQRLWRHCFYKPIGEWRKRVYYEEKKNKPTLRQTQQGFQHFLEESMTMYDYLIGTYMQALTPKSTPMTSQSQDSTASSQDSLLMDSQLPSQDDSVAMIDETAVAPLNAATEPGVVAGLFRLFLCMGDLQRYAKNYNKAEHNYLSASKLGPGHGHPYNQLAVVNFDKENYFASLYWYIRALLVTHQPFGTTSENMQNLFKKNRERLEEFGRDSKPTVLSASSQLSLLSNAKKVSKEETAMARAQKNAAVKSCLAYFVDLHYDFFLMQHNSIALPEQDNVDAARAKMVAVIASLESLMQVSGFGDSLLCKFVVVSAFSLEQSKALTLPSSPTLVVLPAHQFPAEFLYMLGSTLAKQLEIILTKTLEKANPGKTMASVRVLLPLEILVEFVNDLLLEQRIISANANDCHLMDAERDFWMRVAKIGSMVQQVVDRYKLHITAGMPSSAVFQMKEYQVLKGFRPFCCINEEYVHSEDGFLEAVEAMDALDLTQNTQSQASAGASTGSGGGSEENRAKLVRWLELCNKFSAIESIAPLSLGSNGMAAFVYQSHASNDSTAAGLEQVPSQDHGVIAMQSDNDDDDAGDVVVYRLPEDGVGPPLLVPGGLMSGSTKSPPPLQRSYQTLGDDMQKENSSSALFQGMRGDNLELQSSEAVAPSVLPPPGFGPPPSLSTQAGSLLGPGSFPHSSNLLDQVIQGGVATEPLQAYQGSFNSVLPSFGNTGNGDFLFGNNKPLQGHNLTFAESSHLFGDMRTANPFATPMGAPIMNFDLVNTSTRDNNHETSLLDSGLLNSLFGEEVKTSNPWAHG
jgi:hypothetical protein